MKLEDVSVRAFINKHHLKNESGEELNFKQYRFMRGVYSDRSNLIVAMKSAQIGFTTYEIIKTAHECKNEGYDILYVLPTSDDVKRFSGGKTNKIIAQNPVFHSWTKDKDSIEQKQFGQNTVYYQGSWTERAALMITAKKLVVDEYDRCKQQIVEMYDSRLQSVLHPKKAFFSNPSMPDFGVDKYYQLSDQKKWHVTHSCGVRFILDESCVDYTQQIYRCPRCLQEITDEERRMGDWYNKDDVRWTGDIVGDYQWSGWWIPLWVNPIMSAKKIADYKKEKTPEYFANFVAGLPYVGTNNALNQKMLEANLTNKVNDQTGRVIIGVDTGHNIHYVLQNKQGIFYHGYIKSVAENEASPIPIPNYDPYDELERQLKKYPHSIIISDQGGDLIGIRKLQAKYPSRVYLCWFTKETKTQQIIRWGENEETGKVLVDRNRMIQMCVDEITEQRMPINGTVQDWQPYFSHWLNLYRAREIVDEQEPSYGWRWVWKRKGADHFALASVYARIGIDRFPDAKATIVDDSFLAGIPTGRIFTDDSLL